MTSSASFIARSTGRIALILAAALLVSLTVAGCASNPSSDAGSARPDNVETFSLPATVFGECEEKCANSHVRCEQRCDKHDPTVGCYKDCDTQTRACFRDCR